MNTPKFNRIDILDAFQNGPEGYYWEFSNESKTWLQTDSDRPGQDHWYLTYSVGSSEGDDPAYFIEVEPTEICMLQILDQIGTKTWVNKAQLLEAMLPAIRTVTYGLPPPTRK